MDIQSFKRTNELLDKIYSHKLLFVTGAQKSGTTWIQRILDTHPEIVCSGEGHFADEFAVGLTKLTDNYNKQLTAVAKSVYEGNAFYSDYDLDDFNHTMWIMTGLMLAKRPIPEGTIYLGDKTPINAVYINDLHRIFPQAKFVNIVRDGRDVLVSAAKFAKHLQDNVLSLTHEIDVRLESMAEEYILKWLKYVQRTMDFEAKHPDKIITIKYEDLHLKPQKTLENVFDFLQLSTDKEIIDHCINENRFEKITGGRKAGDEDPNSHSRKGIVGDWKNHLSNNNLELFNDIAGNISNKLGYS